MPDKQEQPLNGQQVAEINKRLTALADNIRGDLELRKLALRHACDMVSATGDAVDGKVKYHDPIKLAEGMHAFLTAGARDMAGPNQV